MPTPAPGAQPDSGLTVRGLTAEAGSFRLGPVDLAVPPGRVLVVFGPSGAGKTMLLETIAGLRRPHRGHIRLAGTDLAGLPPERRGISLVFQDAALFPHLSVRENIRFGPRARGHPAGTAIADALLSRLGIGHLASRSPRTLSGGERQRVALARALATRPGLLLLDEPLSALDQPTREDARALLQEVLAGLDIPAIHVTHDRDEALSIGDDLAIITGGRLVQAGPADRVTAAPAGPDAARLLGWSHLGSGTITGPGTVRVGQLTFPGLADPQATGAVQVYYRPEDVLLGSQPGGEAGPGTDGIATVIAEIVPTRPLARVSLASDPPLTALALHRDLERLRAQAGDPVTAALPRASVLAFGPHLEVPSASLVQQPYRAGPGQVVAAECLDRRPDGCPRQRRDQRLGVVEGVGAEHDVEVFPGNRGEVQAQQGGGGAHAEARVGLAGGDRHADLQVCGRLRPGGGACGDAGVGEQPV
jgi:ABC-type Fe3+/spermidine/putrescine transport system ATPase subunit